MCSERRRDHMPKALVNTRVFESESLAVKVDINCDHKVCVCGGGWGGVDARSDGKGICQHTCICSTVVLASDMDVYHVRWNLSLKLTSGVYPLPPPPSGPAGVSAQSGLPFTGDFTSGWTQRDRGHLAKHINYLHYGNTVIMALIVQSLLVANDILCQ